MSPFKRFSLFLLPSVFQGTISLLILPITTHILGPKDYGVFALVISFTSFGTMIATFGSGYLLSMHYPLADEHGKRQLISTFIVSGIVVSVLFSFLFLTGWFIAAKTSKNLFSIPYSGIVLALATMVLSVPWSIASDVIILEGKAKFYAVLTIAQSAVSALAVTAGLYIFKLELLSLFFAGTMGAIVAFAGAVVTLRQHLRLVVSGKWLKEMLKLGAISGFGSIMENIQLISERYLLSVYSGLSQLGIYSHSQQYRSLVSMPVKAVANAMWPITLSEAHEDKRLFLRTAKGWNIVYIGITVAGLFFALLGKDIIDLLTNNKFGEAYAYATLWMLFILVQNIGKTQTGILFAGGHGALYGKITAVSFSMGTGFIVIFVPFVGATGALLALIASQIILRLLIQIYSNRLHKTIFLDLWVLIGSAFILLALGVSIFFHLPMLQRMLVFIFLVGSLTYLARNILAVFLLEGFMDAK